MELRTLRYFLTTVQEGSMTNAAKRLHITQSTLSRQLADLEKETGRQLFTRTHSGVAPTEHGTLLATYAESIIDLADKAEMDLKLPEKSVAGCVHIAAGETKVVGLLGQAMKEVRKSYPDITFRICSGNTADLMDRFVRGEYDFFLECEVRAHVDMNVLKLPMRDTWGIITHKKNPLAKLECIRPEDLAGQPLITSEQGISVEPLRSWAQKATSSFDVVATYNLPHNCRYLVDENLGSMFTYEDIFQTFKGGNLVFVPLEPHIESTQGLVWRKMLLTPPAQVFLDTLKGLIDA